MTFSFTKFRKIPLAWLLLTRQPLRLVVAIAGISFAGILMFMQLGFRDGLFDTSVTIHKLLDADLVLISPRSKSSISMSGFPKRRLIQTLASEDVKKMGGQFCAQQEAPENALFCTFLDLETPKF